jgi:hypothetical protein
MEVVGRKVVVAKIKMRLRLRVLPIYAAGDEAGYVLRWSSSDESPARTVEGKKTRASLPRWGWS